VEVVYQMELVLSQVLEPRTDYYFDSQLLGPQVLE
jgi:hypothetical protein